MMFRFADPWLLCGLVLPLLVLLGMAAFALWVLLRLIGLF